MVFCDIGDSKGFFFSLFIPLVTIVSTLRLLTMACITAADEVIKNPFAVCQLTVARRSCGPNRLDTMSVLKTPRYFLRTGSDSSLS